MAKIGLEAILKMTNWNQGVQQMKGDTAVLNGQTAKTATGFSALGTAITAVSAIAVARFLDSAADAIIALARLGTEAARTEGAFRRVASGVGQSADAILAAMDRATQGTVDDEDMMAVATKAMMMGLELTAEQWGALMAGARQQARLLGMDTMQVFEGMVEAVEKGQPRMLMTLGFSGAKDAINAMGDSLDASTSKMTEAQRQAALYDFVMQQLAVNVEKFGTASFDAVDRMDELAVSWGNFKESLGQQVAVPVLLPVVNDLNKSLLNLSREGVRTLLTTGRHLSDVQRGLNADTARWVAIGGRYADQLENVADAARHAAGPIGTLRNRTLELARSMLAIEIPEAFQYAVDYAQKKGEQMKLDFIQNAVDAFYGVGEVAKDETKAITSDMSKTWESAWDDLRSTVESALQETTVTAADMSASALGTYVDKWDENRRRLQAIVERGGAELGAHPDWAGILGVPEGMDDAGLKQWAQGQINAGPGAWGDVDAAVAVVEQFMAKQSANEAFYDAVARAYAAKHGLTGKQATSAVTKLFGDETAKAATESEAIGAAMLQGIETGIEDEWVAFSKWFTGKIDGLVDEIMASLGIHSPSKVFAGIGQNMIAGLQQGLSMPMNAGVTTTNNSVGGDTIVQNIADPVSFYLAQALVQDRKRTRWNAAMGVAS